MNGSERAFYWVLACVIALILEIVAELITGTDVDEVIFYPLILAFALMPSLLISFLCGLYLLGKYLLAIPYATYLIVWIYGPKWLKPRIKDLIYLTKSRILKPGRVSLNFHRHRASPD